MPFECLYLSEAIALVIPCGMLPLSVPGLNIGNINHYSGLLLWDGGGWRLYAATAISGAVEG